MTSETGDVQAAQFDALISLVSGHTVLAGLFMELLVENDIVTPEEMHEQLRNAHHVAACSVGGMAAAEPIAQLQQRLVARHPYLQCLTNDH